VAAYRPDEITLGRDGGPHPLAKVLAELKRYGGDITLCNIGLAALAQDDAARAEDSYQRALAIAREIGERWIESYALTGLGITLSFMDRLDEAAAHLERAITLRSELDQAALLMESRAALARVALTRGDLDGARIQVEEILAYLAAGHDLSGTEMPCFTLLTCSRVLRADGAPRPGEFLGKGYTWLRERAARLPDENARHLFLQGVPWHREILHDWATEA
jgi:tetratricopeptide (TPR) repeat protein